MSIFSKTQERDYNETFGCVMALYSALQEGRDLLRIKQATIRQDGEVEALALDFLIDVELKGSRALPFPEGQMFTRMVQAGNHDILPSDMKTFLGSVFTWYNLGPDGAYRKLYFKTKNYQVRQALKTALRQPLEDTNGRCIE
jgi:hypothetical protein